MGLFKFMLKVAESSKKLHILAADDTGAAEKNIINKDLGILDDFGVLAEYKGNGSGEYKMPHLLFHTSGGDKIIFVVGYGNKRKWKDALGGQYGCLYIDDKYRRYRLCPGSSHAIGLSDGYAESG